MDDTTESKRYKMTEYVKAQYHHSSRSLHRIHIHNIQTLRRQPLREISGSFGDLGTLLPLLIALTSQSSISLSSTLVFSGLANILTGVIFGLPLPVQPMKAIAAVAIALNFSRAEMTSAGLFVAGCIGVLSGSGLVRWFTGVIPIPVIKGIQVGTGLSLIVSAGPIYDHLPENNWVVFLAFVALLATSTFKRVPYALIVFIVGLFYASSYLPWGYNGSRFAIWHPWALVPSPKSFLKGMGEAGIGQVPLTTLNSLIAVSFLAADLCPEVPTPSPTALGVSVTVFNLIGCWFGAMPICHGSGGLAAQHRFGARSGASVIFLGLIKLVIGFFASPIAKHLIDEFPTPLLCVLLVAAGLELAKVGETVNTPGAARDLDPGLDPDRDLPPDAYTSANIPIINPPVPPTPTTVNTETPSPPSTSPDRATAAATNGSASDSTAKPPTHPQGLSQTTRNRRWTILFTTVAGILAFKNDAVGFLAGMLCHVAYTLQDRWEARQEGRIRLAEGTADGDDGDEDSHSVRA